MEIKDLSKELNTKELSAVQGGADDRGNAGVLGIAQIMALSAPNTVLAGPGSAVNNFNNISATQNAEERVHQNNGETLKVVLGLFGGDHK
jgi:bacteriocin-like protein